VNRTVAVVPMRHASERVVGKNYRPLAGVPLYHHVVRTLLSVVSIDEVVIDTDSEVILEDAARLFPGVRLLVRPEHLRDGETPMTDVLAHTLRSVDADVVVQTHATNPFLKPSTIEAALGLFAQAPRDFDSIFSVTRLQARLWGSDGQPINHDPAVLLRTQDLAPVFIENSSFFIFPSALLLQTGNRIGERPRMFEMSPIEAIDIDTEDDWALADAIASGAVVSEATAR